MIRWCPVIGGKRQGEVTVSQAQVVYELHAVGRGLVTVAGLSVPPSEVEGFEACDNDGRVVHRMFVDSGRGSGDEVQREVTLAVVDEMGRLANARAWPEPSGNWGAQAEDVFEGQASGALLYYLRRNIGADALPARQYGYRWLVLPDDPEVGGTVEARARFDGLLDLLADIALVGKVVFAFGDDGALVVREPVERAIEISESVGTASRVDWAFSVPRATALVAGGAGEGVDRLLVQVQNGALVQSYGWREDFVNDSRFSVESSLRQRAYAALAARGGGWAADALLANDSLIGLRWRMDWWIGDVFPVHLPDGVHMMTVKGVVVTYDNKGGRQLRLSLVESMHLNSPSWLDDGLGVDRRVRLLETA